MFGISQITAGAEWNDVVDVLFDKDVKKVAHGVKDFMGLALSEGVQPEGFVFDTELAAYVLDPTESSYPIERLSSRDVYKRQAFWVFSIKYICAKIKCKNV